MLLWVGAVLVVNGVWLIGQARAAHAARQPAAAAGGAAPGVAVEGQSSFVQGREGILLLEDVIASEACCVNSRARRLHTTRRASANRA
jgi:hypothetical protein